MKIKIGVTNYDVKTVPECMVVPQELCYGCCNSALAEIKISEDIDDDSKIRVFFHEITHAMLDEMGSEHSCDENFVEGLSRQIYGAFTNNNLKKICEQLCK